MGVRCWVCVYILLILPGHLLTLKFEFSRLQAFSNHLDNTLGQYLDDAMGKTFLEKEYDKVRKDVTFYDLEPAKLLDKMAEKLGYEVLGKKRSALQASVEFAEAVAKNYTFDPTLNRKNGEFKPSNLFHNTKLVNGSSPEFEYSDKFLQKVSYAWSTVHIPVEIFEGDIEIVNGLNWTYHLDEVYKQNLQKDPELLWQYFGSQRGFIRSYPGTKWRRTSGVDLYDVRRRPWYTQGSSSPKDMFILLDTSGSMHGQGLQLMKVTVKVLLDTLGENDYVAVANFSNEAHYVSCLKSFVQANHKNKRVFSNEVDKLTANGMAHYSIGLDFALKSFVEFSRNATDGQGAECNKVIMLITDGGEDFAKDVLEKHKELLKSVRIFTYAIGQGAGPMDAAKYFACKYRGYYSPITGMGAIRTKVQEHVPVLSRPLCLSNARWFRWSNVYSDALSKYVYDIAKSFAYGHFQEIKVSGPHYYNAVKHADTLSRPTALAGIQEFQWSKIYYDRWGLGMMTTLTLPVYNRSAESSNQTILGVMGVDVTTKDMESQTPKREIGIRGYAFAINANGFIVFHPNLKGQHGYLNDPPNVDLVEIEWSSKDKLEMRKRMIRNETGSHVIDNFVLYEAERYIRKEKLTYYFRGIPGTEFSIGFAIPEGVEKYLKVKPGSKTAGIEALRSNTSEVILAPWNYCRNITIGNLGKVNDPAVVIEQIASGDRACVNTEDLVPYLLWDAKACKDLHNKWVEFDEKHRGDMVFRIVQTLYGGLTRAYPASGANASYGALAMHEMWKHSLNQAADAHEGYHFRAPYTAGPFNLSVLMDLNVTNLHSVTVATAVRYKTERVTTAVLVAQLSAIKLHAFLTNLTNDEADVCSDDLTVDCYLLDEGAFIVSTNQELQTTGRFLGRVDTSLMNALVNNSIFKKTVFWDHQAACPPEKATVSAGPRTLTVPLFYEALSLNWWTAGITWLWMNFNLYNMLFSSPSSFVSAELGTDAFTNRSCTNETYQYHYALSNSSFQGSISCSLDCSRDFSVFKFSQSNLFLVIADRSDTCDNCPSQPLPQEPSISEGPNMCVEPHRYRHRPDQCFSYSPEEDYSDCGRSSNVVPSVGLLCTLIFARFL